MGIRIANVFISLTNIVLSIISFFIGLEIILKLLSANTATPVVSWVYSVAGFFVNPFFGIFPDIQMGSGVLDIVAIIALVAYTIAGFLIKELFRSLALTTEEASPSTVHYHDVDSGLIDADEEDRPRKRYYSK